MKKEKKAEVVEVDSILYVRMLEALAAEIDHIPPFSSFQVEVAGKIIF